MAKRGRRGKRPAQLVVFRPGCQRAAAMIEEIARVAPEEELTQEGVMTAFAAPASSKPAPRLYDRLGVAALDLDDEQCRKFEEHEEVAQVVPNLLRYAQVLERGAGRARPLSGTYGGTIGAGTYGGTIGAGTYGGTIGAGGYGGVGAHPADLAAAYLRGQADALAATLRFGSTPPAPAAALSGGSHSWCLDRVGVDANYSRATGRGVKVAVLDTGIALSHPDFEGRFVEGDPWDDPEATAVSFAAGETVEDGNGHGTHCAGVVGGKARSSGGRRYGVAPDVDLLVAKVLSDEGSGYDSDILEAIAWAVERGARVISMSLGSARGVNEPHAASYERVASELLASGDGPLLVTAAGNESERPGYVAPVGNPAACPSFLAAAAVDGSSDTAWFSCGQRDSVGMVDLSAPGVDVYSSLSGPERFGTLNGTSMACPHVVGVAALWLEKEPGLKAHELWSRLEHHAHPLPAGSAAVGRGIVQAP